MVLKLANPNSMVPNAIQSVTLKVPNLRINTERQTRLTVYAPLMIRVLQHVSRQMG